MTKAKWRMEFQLKSILPIDLSLPKPYVLADSPFNKDHWIRAFQTEEGIVVAQLSQKEHLTQDLFLNLEAKTKLSDTVIDEIIDKISYECGLNENLETVRKECEKDILADIAVKTNPGFRLFANSNVIETALFAIFFQNMEFIGFQHLKEKFMAQLGEPVPWNPQLRVFPSKEKLADMSHEEWEKFGLGYKSEYLGAMTLRDWKNIEIYAYYPIYERGLAGMESIQGIGPYTSRLIMIYAMRRYERAFYDAFVQEMLEHKYRLSTRMPLSEFDSWVKRKWPNEPALILHTHLQEYFPKFMRALDLAEIKKEYYGE